MPSAVSFRPGKLVDNILATAGATRVALPAFALLPYDWAPNCAIAAVFTPTGTSVTLNPTAADAITITNGTLREYVAVGATSMADAVCLIAFARRKPGTTGTIASQVVTITINSVAIGRFKVAATSGSEDPASGTLLLLSPSDNADDRITLGTNDLVVGVTAADPDLEIVFIALGSD